jgi:shikimate dehydrogenase
MNTPNVTPYAEVIGDPISHSKSPRLHGYWLHELGLEGEYRAHQVAGHGLADYVNSRRDDPLWRGCNITLPHKVAIMDLVDDPGDVRGSIGAMNTIFRSDTGALVGTNTDAAGFYAPIADMSLAGAHAVVIGTGGAACAVFFALARANIGFVTVMARNPLKGAALLARFGLKGEVKGMDAPLPSAALLVNATQLGMTGQLPLLIDLDPLPDDAVVYDIVYTPLETPLLAAARARDLDCVDGLNMFIGQAAIAFELFFGVAPPLGSPTGESDSEPSPDDALRAVLLA